METQRPSHPQIKKASFKVCQRVVAKQCQGQQLSLAISARINTMKIDQTAHHLASHPSYMRHFLGMPHSEVAKLKCKNKLHIITCLKCQY